MGSLQETNKCLSGENNAQESQDVIEMEDRSSVPGSSGPPLTQTDCGIAQDPDIRLININQVQPIKYCLNEVDTGKYTFITFFPKFLFEQFRRYANVFFLFIALLQQIPSVSPTGHYTTLLPLIFILLVSAVKEIVEDIKRHRADDEVNNRKVLVLRDHMWVPLRWRELGVGDVVQVKRGEFFPADLVLLSSSAPQAMCYIETAQLDGETNLKIRQGLSQTANLCSEADLMTVDGTVECELPNRHLYEFVGNIKLKRNQTMAVPLSTDQILLRGATLRNTKWIHGIVIYTGHESKLLLNSKTAPLKRSTVDRTTNIQILFLFLILMVLALISAIAAEIWNKKHFHKDWYLGFEDKTPNSFFFNFLTFIILYNNLIPISLPVTLELVKFGQALFINFDLDMYHAETDTPAAARTSNLNDELGQVKYVFSDKTGTLTQNIMEFKICTIAGIVYGDNPDVDIFRDSKMADNLESHSTAPHIRMFVTMMAVCHTVVPEKDLNDQIIYQASSPDEGALVEAAAKLGFRFIERTPDSVEIVVMGKQEKYEILNVLDFTSDRKRMSVIVRTSNGTILLFCKGADNVIYDRLASDQEFTSDTVRHLEEFASEGLRTLCFAFREISKEEYEEWSATYYKASTAIQNREEKLAEAAELIEMNFTLIGASAIEDKLQDGVPETIDTLLKADVKIWVLTGDKQETAINVGYSCKLLNPAMPLLIINETSHDEIRETLQRHITAFGDQIGKENDVALIINGEALKFALSFDLRKDFLELAMSCKSVICCRVTPLQKAELVDLVKQNVKAVTLAIGDGANDVGMIQAADVGIGISGREGLQAANSSDYSIAQFRFLHKLMLVHGVWSYNRISKVILYSFYKNICLYIMEFWFAIVNGWSGQILFNRWAIGIYNLVFTALPPFAIGLFDRNISVESMKRFPQLYKSSQNAEYFNSKVFWMWTLNSVFHSILIYWFVVTSMQQDVAWGNGKAGDYLVAGNMAYTCVLVVVTLKAGLEMDTWTWPVHVSLWFGLIAWVVFFGVYSVLFPLISFASDMFNEAQMVFSSTIFWMLLLLIPVAALIRDVAWKAFRRTMYKTLAEEVQEAEVQHIDPTAIIQKSVKKRLHVYIFSETSRLLTRLFKRSPSSTRHLAEEEGTPRHGFAFSQEEHGVITQAEVIRAYDTTKRPTGAVVIHEEPNK
ncbi:probable phospholipid-transporting ATPase IA isoform X2 [Lytechinus pictus]|uniref:probable phospholipid-transporting ATPase IA isoform X2 n=1 Tax=Lytechinus pictus TaxID=7653 RepID=UPI00240DCA3B|nr:probable phospholipid-transporting ATPase IA isoform X2 [Lytechinus pictus]